MRTRFRRTIATSVGILLLASTPVKAGPIVLNQVIQVVNNYNSPPQLRLQDPGQGGSSSRQREAKSTGSDSLVSSPVDTSTGKTVGTDSLLSGISVGNPEQQEGVDVVAQGDLEGVICDCGEFEIPGGFPRWPLIFLAAIPFFFWPDCKDCDPPCVTCDDSTPTPTPTPTPPPEIPEPASLLLLGTGLAAFGAGLRRRRSAKLSGKAELNSTSEEG